MANSRGEILAIDDWPTNAALIAEVRLLGYLDGTVLDASYGLGNFWTDWRPDRLVGLDRYTRADVRADFRYLPFADQAFDAVVLDPPYKLNGTPALGEQDARYGTTGRSTRDEVLDLIVDGAQECYRVARRYLLVKCMDQVEGGRMRWQTDLVTEALSISGAWKVDRFDFPGAGRAQPPGRVQRTARHEHSQLLVFRRPRATPRVSHARARALARDALDGMAYA